MNDTVPTNRLPIRLSVRLLDDDGAPWPGAVNVRFADRPGRTHHISVAPNASDTDLGQALRQVVARELAARDAEQAQGHGED